MKYFHLLSECVEEWSSTVCTLPLVPRRHCLGTKSSSATLCSVDFDMLDVLGKAICCEGGSWTVIQFWRFFCSNAIGRSEGSVFAQPEATFVKEV